MVSQDTNFIQSMNSRRMSGISQSADLPVSSSLPERDLVLKDSLLREDTHYVFWYHAPFMVERMAGVLRTLLKTHNPSTVNVFLETVGGTQQQRAEEELSLNTLINNADNGEWSAYYREQGEKLAQIERAFGVVLSGPREDLETKRAFRILREELDIPFLFRFIDADEDGSEYAAVSRASELGKELGALFNLSPSEVLRRKQSVDLQGVILTSISRYLKAGGEEIKARNALLARQLHAGFEENPEVDLNLILLGNGHAGLLPDGSSGDPRVTSLRLGQSTIDHLPKGFRETGVGNIGLQIKMKLAEGAVLSQADIVDCLLDFAAGNELKREFVDGNNQAEGLGRILSEAPTLRMLSALLVQSFDSDQREALVRRIFLECRQEQPLVKSLSAVIVQILREHRNCWLSRASDLPSLIRELGIYKDFISVPGQGSSN
jgi:hypothetical protein